MVSIEGYTLISYVIVMVAAYVLWLSVLILDAMSYLEDDASVFRSLYGRRGVYGALAILCVLGWGLLTAVLWFPVRIGVVFAIVGALLVLLVQKGYVLIGRLNVSMFEPKRKVVKEDDVLMEDVTIGVRGGFNGREGP